MLALIAGQGALPGAVARAQPELPVICALEGFPPDALTPDFTFRLEKLGDVFPKLRKMGVTRICLCGRVARPKVDPWAISLRSWPLVPRILKALKMGDDGALRVVIALFEERGFTVEAAHVAAPDLIPDVGVLTETPVPEQARLDGLAGDEALIRMGQADLGQACLVLNGHVIATETDDGTDALISSQGRADAVLYKAPKPNQDRRADLPTIGPNTARNAVSAGLAGIVIEAGGVIVLEQAETFDILNKAGLFLWSRERPV